MFKHLGGTLGGVFAQTVITKSPGKVEGLQMKNLTVVRVAAKCSRRGQVRNDRRKRAR